MLVSLIFFYFLDIVVSIPFLKPDRHTSAPRIIGGQVAYAGQFPFLVSINVKLKNDSHLCGGTLINSQWVVTSGSCIYRAISVMMRFGSKPIISCDPDLFVLYSESYVIHPNFNISTFANNIGAIQFHKPIQYTDYIKPVDLLPSAPLPVGSASLTMGWGKISDNATGLQDKVHWVSVTTISNEDCKFYYGNQILDDMVCAKGNTNEGLCCGDIGGPLIRYVNEADVMLVGVASFISGQGCETTDPSGYTRTFDFVDWIRNTTGFI